MQSYYAYFDPDDENQQPSHVVAYQPEQPTGQIDSGLADQIIRMLSEPKKPNLRQPATTPLPTGDWQDQLYYSNPFLINGTIWLTVGFLVQHLITFIVTFDYWGHGDAFLIGISAGQILCAVYALLLSWLPNGSALSALFSAWTVFVLVFWAEILLMSTVVFSGLFGEAIADQMSMYRISENIVASATIDGLPFILLYLLTWCVYNTRWYEVNSKPRDFSSSMDPLPWNTKNQTKRDPGVVDEIDTLLLASMLQAVMQDPAVKTAAVAPEARRNRPKEPEVLEQPCFTINYI